MTVHEIKRFLENQYEMEVLTHLIGTVIDSVMEDVIEWQNLPLMYPIMFFDALWVEIRDERLVKNKALYLAA